MQNVSRFGNDHVILLLYLKWLYSDQHLCEIMCEFCEIIHTVLKQCRESEILWMSSRTRIAVNMIVLDD